MVTQYNYVLYNSSLLVSSNICSYMTLGNLICTDSTEHILDRLYDVGHMVKDHSARDETRFRHYMGYSFRLAAKYF